jgi:hypothetical protein
VIGVEIGPWGRIGSKRSIGDVGDTDRARAAGRGAGRGRSSAPASWGGARTEKIRIHRCFLHYSLNSRLVYR